MPHEPLLKIKSIISIKCSPTLKAIKRPVTSNKIKHAAWHLAVLSLFEILILLNVFTLKFNFQLSQKHRRKIEKSLNQFTFFVAKYEISK